MPTETITEEIVGTYTLRELWLHDGGEISCTEHGGMALKYAWQSSAKHSPTTLHTERGMWTLVTQFEIDVWHTEYAEYIDSVEDFLHCETCDALPAVRV